MKKYKLLNVGGNSKEIAIPEIYAEFDHQILDIDERVEPDILGDARELTKQTASYFDAVYCSHNLEHYHEHEVKKVLNGFLHILKDGGLAHIRVPDIADLIDKIANQKIGLNETLYMSGAGPIRPLDIFYGLSREIEESGHDFFAHKTGFTESTLISALENAGFSSIYTARSELEISAIAFKGEPKKEFLAMFGIQKENQAPGGMVDAFLEQGMQAIIENDIAAAIQCFENAAQVAPDNAEIQINLATAYFKGNDLPRALQYVDAALAIEAGIPEAFNLKGVILLAQGAPEKAISNFSAALALNADYLDCLKNLYVAYRSNNQEEFGLVYLQKAIEIEEKAANRLEDSPPQAEISLAVTETEKTGVMTVARAGLSAFEQGDFEASIDYFTQAIEFDPSIPALYNNRGLAHEKTGNDERARADYKAALDLSASFFDALYNLANLEEKTGSPEAARILFKKCLELKPGNPAVLKNLSASLLHSKDYQAAFNTYRTAITSAPNDPDLYYGASCAQMEMDETISAIGFINKALTLDPNHVDALHNRGFILKALGINEHALADFEKCLTLDDQSPKTLSAIADVHLLDKNIDKALPYLEQAYALDKTLKLLEGKLLHAKMQTAAWHQYEEILESISKATLQGNPRCQPFDLQSVTDEGAVLQAASRNYCKAVCAVQTTDHLPARRDRKKIRIGYFSSDFGNHPVTHLTVGLIAEHDRDNYEVYCFALQDREDDFRNRVYRSADRYINLENLGTDEAVQLIRNAQIDIAVDLNGFTSHHRTDLFARRIAPVQINYLGFLGTLGANFIDYIIADRHIIPESERPFYTEKVIYLPSYQCNDDTPLPVGNRFTRNSFNLDEHAFIFASFNNVYKITPVVFKAWIEILNGTPDSQLWLYAKERKARKNLLNFAAEHGLSPERIIFAENIDYASHMERHKLADLFLDTTPYNGGATTSNALRAGVPVISLAGRSFSSRYGLSLLNAIGLPELATDDINDYKNLAIRIGNDRAYHQSIKAKLGAQMAHSPLFNTRQFTRTLESAFVAALNRHDKGLPPDHLFI